MRRKLQILFCGALVMIGLALFPVKTVHASSLEESIKQKQQAISQAQSEKKHLQSGLTNVQNIINSLKSKQSDLQSYIKELDEKLTELDEKIEELKEQITQKQADIEETQAELDVAESVAQQQYADMKVRIQYMYEQSHSGGYLTQMLAQGSLMDLQTQTEYVEKISAYDKRKLLEYEQNVAYVKLCKETLEEEKSVLDETQKTLEEEEENVNALIAEKEKEFQAYSADISAQQMNLKEYQALIASQNAEIAALEKAVAAEKAALAEQNRIKYDGGMFQMPCPGYTRISDNYGNRIHPILKTQQFHNGVDFAAPSGTAILAAYNGKVVAAAYNASMGNYIMIDHGDGLYTIYMHASKLYVSTGQTVSKGAKIAAVGSTGRSTGPHLHFSVRLNGNYTSPWNYLK